MYECMGERVCVEEVSYLFKRTCVCREMILDQMVQVSVFFSFFG